MQRLNISKGRAFIMVYSVTSRQSLEQLESTWKTIREIKVYIFFPLFYYYFVCTLLFGFSWEVASTYSISLSVFYMICESSFVSSLLYLSVQMS